MMKRYSIDINADVGEGIGNEAQLMPFLSSCNIACGGHAGDTTIMAEVVKLARENRVKIGAHPSYPDRENFGRKKMDISCSALYKSLKTQVHALIDVLDEHHGQLHHIKPHGALYNEAAVDEETASIVIELMKSIPLPVKLYVPFGSVIAKVAKHEGIPITYEAFADRNYNPDLTLVSRQLPNALITDAESMFEHVIRILKKGVVKTVNREEVVIKAETFCIHGDNPKAVSLLKSLRQKLLDNRIELQ